MIRAPASGGRIFWNPESVTALSCCETTSLQQPHYLAPASAGAFFGGAKTGRIVIQIVRLLPHSASKLTPVRGVTLVSDAGVSLTSPAELARFTAGGGTWFV